MNTFYKALKTTRPPFLILTPVSVLMAYSSAIYQQQTMPFYLLILVLFSALFAHISVNSLNEYQDFNSGLDFKTQQTPFSGGSGTLIQFPELKNTVMSIFIFSIVMVLLAGIYFILLRGWTIILFGGAGLLIIFSYTNWINKHPWLCLLAPGIAFGPLMIIGSSLVLVNSFSTTLITASLLMFFLVNNLLLLNQIPDVDADSSIGRNHLTIRYGLTTSIYFYALFNCLSIATIVVGCSLGIFPPLSLYTLIPLSLFIIVLYGLLKFRADIYYLIPFLGINVALTVISPAVLSATLLYSI